MFNQIFEYEKVGRDAAAANNRFDFAAERIERERFKRMLRLEASPEDQEDATQAYDEAYFEAIDPL